jgi:hypothetical protein
MNYNIDPIAAKAAIDKMVADLREQNTPEALAKRDAAARARKFGRGISYRRQCDAADARVLGAGAR